MSSLATQLNRLKIAQKETVSLPERSRVSLLFDIGKAANIDDATILALAQSAVKELTSTVPAMLPTFSQYQEFFSEQAPYLPSLTATKLAELTKRMDTFIHALSGYLNLPATHKVLEHLVRSYQAHAHLPMSLIFASMPLHNQNLFTRIAQIAKTDELPWLADVVKDGSIVTEELVITAMARQNGQLLSKYCDWLWSGEIEANRLH